MAEKDDWHTASRDSVTLEGFVAGGTVLGTVLPRLAQIRLTDSIAALALLPLRQSVFRLAAVGILIAR